MKTDPVLQLLGLAQRARGVVSGEFMTESSVKDGSAFLVIVAQDASDNTRKQFADMCAYYKVPCYFYSDKEHLGHGIGKEFRASIAVTNQSLAEEIIRKIDGGSKYGEN